MAAQFTTLFAGSFDSVALNTTDGSIALLIGEESAKKNMQEPRDLRAERRFDELYPGFIGQLPVVGI